jgi:hypothetical protein
MVVNFVDLADEARKGNTDVSSCRDVGKQYIAHFEKLSGRDDLVKMVKSMQYGKRRRERREANRRYAAEDTTAKLTVAHPSQEPQPQSWLGIRVVRLRPMLMATTPSKRRFMMVMAIFQDLYLDFFLLR